MRDSRIEELVELAFEYRGYVTVSRHDGSAIVGYIYDRGPTHVEMFDEHGSQRIRIVTDEIADVALSGDDAAALAQQRWERRRGSLEPPHTSVWGEWAQRPVLIVVALRNELRGVARALDAKIRGHAVRRRIGDGVVVARVIGVGGGAAHTIAAEQPRVVINCGYAGALDAALHTGDVVLASSIHDETGEVIEAQEPVLRAMRRALDGFARVSEGAILSASEVAATSAEKRALARPGRLAVDLESWVVARAAERAGIPCMTLRVVLDPLDLDLPELVRKPRDSYVTAALRHALRGPRAAIELARLAKRADDATRSLQRALAQLVPLFAGFGSFQERT